jgi:hypothetical protein
MPLAVEEHDRCVRGFVVPAVVKDVAHNCAAMLSGKQGREKNVGAFPGPKHGGCWERHLAWNVIVYSGFLIAR